MRTVLIFTLLFAIALPCFSQLTEQGVRQIIREELEPVKLDIAEMKVKMVTKEGLEPIKLDIAEIKSKMVTKEELEPIKLDIVEMKGKMATKDDIIGVYAAILVTWVVTIAAIITIPYLYGRADRERVKQLEGDVRELVKLRAEVGTLKAIMEAENKRKETARKIAEEKPEFAEAYKMVGLL